MKNYEIKNTFLNNEKRDYYFKNEEEINNFKITTKKRVS